MHLDALVILMHLFRFDRLALETACLILKGECAFTWNRHHAVIDFLILVVVANTKNIILISFLLLDVPTIHPTRPTPPTKPTLPPTSKPTFECPAKDGNYRNPKDCRTYYACTNGSPNLSVGFFCIHFFPPRIHIECDI